MIARDFHREEEEVEEVVKEVEGEAERMEEDLGLAREAVLAMVVASDPLE